MIEDYVRNARLVRVIDGDTVELDIDLGFSLWLRKKVRLLGVNCPEMHGPSKEAGEKAKQFVVDWFAKDNNVQVKTHIDKTDSFGRVLAEIERKGEVLAAQLIESGNAVIMER